MKEPQLNCTDARSQFALMLYGELSFDEEERVETHLDGCTECRAALANQKALHAALDAAEVTASPALLARCREDFAGILTYAQPAYAQPTPAISQEAEVRDSGEKPGWWAEFLSSFKASRWRPAFVPAGALALLAVGFLSAQFVPNLRTNADFSALNLADADGSQIRNVSTQQDGSVEIVLDETRQRTVTGSMDDQAVRALLLAASKQSADPALRADSVAILVNRAGSADVRDALLFALENDQSEGVRSKAMDGLKPYASDHAVQGALAQVLVRDGNRGMRTRAIDLLAARDQRDLDREIVGVLQELMDHEEDPYVRERGLRVLREMNASAGIY